MAGTKNLKELLSSMKPNLHEDEFVFCTIKNMLLTEVIHFNPIGYFIEEEGTTLIVTKDCAESNNIPFDCTFGLISLTIHSSLEAVGLTAAIAQRLADNNISANVVAAYYHDHIFVPLKDSSRAMIVLHELQKENSDQE
ncbi:MAG: ACT domain-containing protein [Dysgonomonas sp.]|nr:ACT domain-containing protein [Dysgonomonas sp.]